jgi:DNA-binding transcriptional MerR regulator
VKDRKKIGEIAGLLGTTPRTLRFYEEEGLVTACRSVGGTRYYGEEEVGRFRAILRLAEGGFSLEDIRLLARERERHPTGSSSSEAMIRRLGNLLDVVRRRQGRLAQLEKELNRAAEAVAGCRGCDKPPTRQGCPDCPVNRLTGESDILNLIWEPADNAS